MPFKLSTRSFRSVSSYARKYIFDMPYTIGELVVDSSALSFSAVRKACYRRSFRIDEDGISFHQAIKQDTLRRPKLVDPLMIKANNQETGFLTSIPIAKNLSYAIASYEWLLMKFLSNSKGDQNVAVA